MKNKTRNLLIIAGVLVVGGVAFWMWKKKQAEKKEQVATK